MLFFSSKTKAGACAISTNPLNLKRTTKMQGRRGDSRNSSDTREKFIVLETAVSVLSFACDSANLQVLLFNND